MREMCFILYFVSNFRRIIRVIVCKRVCARKKMSITQPRFSSIDTPHPTLHLSIHPPPTPARATSDGARRTAHGTVCFAVGDGEPGAVNVCRSSLSAVMSRRVKSVPISFTYRARELFLSKHIECANYFFRNISVKVFESDKSR